MNRDFEDELQRTRQRPSRRRQSAVQNYRMPQKKHKNRRTKTIIAMIVAECLALTFIFSYAFVAKRWNMIQRPDFELSNVKNVDLDVDTVEKMKGYWTIAVFGVDSRNNNVGKGTNADVNMICNINQDTGEIKLVSVFRDSYLNINDKNSYNKLNMAYAQGGPEQAVKVLNKNLDLNITDYVTFNWKAVADAINILGGVDVEISKAEFYYINSFITETVKATGIGSHQLKKAGMNHLDGVQAVAYGRLRLMDSDFARTERQRKIIELAFEKAKKADLAVLNNIMLTVFPQVATSVDLTDLTSMAGNVKKYHISETGGFPFARGDANMGKKGACVIPQTLESNVIQLHEFLFGSEAYEPSSTVKTISSKIAADTGMYKEGKSIDHVGTSGGYVPKPTKAPETTSKKETKEEETDENGDVVNKKETKETKEGETTQGRPGGDSSGWETWATDEDGNPIDPAWGETKPTLPSDNKETSAESSESAEGPGHTKAPTHESTTGVDETVENKPGIPPTTATETIAPSPGTSAGSEGPGGNSNSTGVIIGAPGTTSP